MRKSQQLDRQADQQVRRAASAVAFNLDEEARVKGERPPPWRGTANGRRRATESVGRQNSRKPPRWHPHRQHLAIFLPRSTLASLAAIGYADGARGQLAQLVRALLSHGRGHRFESSIAHCQKPRKLRGFCRSLGPAGHHRRPLAGCQSVCASVPAAPRARSRLGLLDHYATTSRVCSPAGDSCSAQPISCFADQNRCRLRRLGRSLSILSVCCTWPAPGL